MSIAIIDYGCGNVGSVQNMLSKIGVWSETIKNPENLNGKKGIILPGVGTYDMGVEKLKETGFWDALQTSVGQEKMPILGICLGMQLFFEGSAEGSEKGFGWIEGTLKRFEPGGGIRVPHMGWKNVIQNKKNSPCFFDDVRQEFYFVHSYHAPIDLPDEYTLGFCEYGIKFPAAVSVGNITGFQFHPEKSLNNGMDLLLKWHETIQGT